jgi:hypothetical protein
LVLAPVLEGAIAAFNLCGKLYGISMRWAIQLKGGTLRAPAGSTFVWMMTS